MLYLSSIFVYSSVFFRYSDFVQVKVEIILRDDSSCFRYSTGYVFCFIVWRSFFVLHLFTQQSWKSQIF